MVIVYDFKRIFKIKDSLYGEHKEYKYICAIILKQHAQGMFYKTENTDNLNNWIWLAKYQNIELDQLIQRDGNIAKKALVGLLHGLIVLGMASI